MVLDVVGGSWSEGGSIAGQPGGMGGDFGKRFRRRRAEAGELG